MWSEIRIAMLNLSSIWKRVCEKGEKERAIQQARYEKTAIKATVHFFHLVGLAEGFKMRQAVATASAQSTN